MKRGLIGVAVLALAALFYGSRSPVVPETPGEKPQEAEDKGSLTLQLLTREGAVVEQCAATLWQRVEGGRRVGADSSQACTSGALHFSALDDGEYQLMVAVEGHEWLEQSVDIVPGCCDLGSIALGPGVRVTGTVLDDGVGVADAVVRLGSREERSREGGVFLFRGVPPGPHKLWAGLGTQSASGELQIEGAEDRVLDLSLQEGRPRGLLGLRFEGGAQGARVTAVMPGGPAENRVQPGDLVSAIEGRDLRGLEGGDLVLALLGEPGEKARLVLSRDGVILEVELTRKSAVDVSQK